MLFYFSLIINIILSPLFITGSHSFANIDKTFLQNIATTVLPDTQDATKFKSDVDNFFNKYWQKPRIDLGDNDFFIEFPKEKNVLNDKDFQGDLNKMCFVNGTTYEDSVRWQNHNKSECRIIRHALIIQNNDRLKYNLLVNDYSQLDATRYLESYTLIKQLFLEKEACFLKQIFDQTKQDQKLVIFVVSTQLNDDKKIRGKIYSRYSIDVLHTTIINFMVYKILNEIKKSHELHKHDNSKLLENTTKINTPLKNNNYWYYPIVGLIFFGGLIFLLHHYYAISTFNQNVY